MGLEAEQKVHLFTGTVINSDLNIDCAIINSYQMSQISKYAEKSIHIKKT